MTSGMMNYKILGQLFIFQLAFYPLLSFPLICSADKQLERLLQPFIQISFVHFSYTETRNSLFFKKAQKSTGEIQFRKPDLIIKYVLTPQKQKFSIKNNQLIRYNSDNKKDTLNINDYPQLKNYIALIKAILSGDAVFLRQYYNISIENPAYAWLFILTPKNVLDALWQKSIKSIQISGIDDRINSIKIAGFAGEQSELIIEKIIEQQNYADPKK